MNIPFIILCVLGGLTLAGLFIIALLAWIGRGESDVNGEKECDAGWTEAENRMRRYLAARRQTIEGSVQAEVLACNKAREAQERTALAEITAMQVWMAKGGR